MTIFVDRAYFDRRAAEEAMHAEQATAPAIAAIRYEMAYRYSLLAAGKKMTLAPVLRLVA